MNTQNKVRLTLLILSTFIVTGCAWIQAHPNTVTAIEQNAIRIGASIAQSSLSNGTIDYAQAVPLGLSSVTNIVAGLSADKAKPVIANAVNSFSAWTIPETEVTKIVNTYIASNPRTPAERKTFLIAAANGLSVGIDKVAK